VIVVRAQALGVDLAASSAGCGRPVQNPSSRRASLSVLDRVTASTKFAALVAVFAVFAAPVAIASARTACDQRRHDLVGGVEELDTSGSTARQLPNRIFFAAQSR